MDNRPAVLEFLRNLTPQVILFVLATLTLNNSQEFFKEGNYPKSILSFTVTSILFLVWFYAFIANYSILFEKICSSFVELEKIQKDLKSRNVKGLKLYSALCKSAWGMKTVLTLQFFVFITLTFVGYFAVLFQAAYLLVKLEN